MKTVEKLQQEVNASREEYNKLTTIEKEILNAKMDVLFSLADGELNDESQIEKYLNIIETFFQLRKQADDECHDFIFYDDKFEIFCKSFAQFETRHVIEFTENGYVMKGRASHAKDYDQYAYNIDVEFRKRENNKLEDLFEAIYFDVAHAFEVINEMKRKRQMKRDCEFTEAKNENVKIPPVPPVPTF